MPSCLPAACLAAVLALAAPASGRAAAVNVKDHGAAGDGLRDDADAIQAALDAVPAQGGVLEFPAGRYLVGHGIDGRGRSNVAIRGAGTGATVIECTEALDGSDPERFNAVFNFNNLKVPFGSYLADVSVSDMTIDCSKQSANGVPKEALYGYNLCAVECQNVDRARFERLRIVRAFGNALVSGSIDPGMDAALKGATVRDCEFIECVRGVMPQYKIAGSVVQYGAMRGGRIEGCEFIDSGGPAIDVFNCHGTQIVHNLFRGGQANTAGRGQTVNSIHSDFGLVDVVIAHNVLEDAGPILLGGLMVPTFFNDQVGTPGPRGCVIEGNVLRDTARIPWAEVPDVPASPGRTVNTSDAPAIVEVSGGAGVVVRVGGAAQALTGEGHNRFVVPAGGEVRLEYAAAPTWRWWHAPNALTGAIMLAGGSAAGHPLGGAVHNVVRGNLIERPPVDAFVLYDCRDSQFQGNLIVDPGDAQPAAAFACFDTAGVPDSGCRGLTIAGNLIRDSRRPKMMSTNFRASTANTRDNRLGPGNRLEEGGLGAYVVADGAPLDASGNHGPGAAVAGD